MTNLLKMKQTEIYKWLEKTQNENSIYNGDFKSGFLENIANIITVPFLSLMIMILGTLSILLLPLYLIKDLYDLYCYVNAEKIAKKIAIKKALKLKNDIKNWIKNYQLRLDSTSKYMLEKIIYEEKPKIKKLHGLDNNYQNAFGYNPLYCESSYSTLNCNFNHYPKDNVIVKKELLTKELINSTHSKFENFIFQFFIQYNNECNTVIENNQHICDTKRRRTLHDIYLITKYYYSEITFTDVIKTILFLLKSGTINGSYCTTVRKYVFYTPNFSNHSSFSHKLEFTDKLTFINLKEYIENEK